jgi:hypothetical protein
MKMRKLIHSLLRMTPNFRLPMSKTTRRMNRRKMRMPLPRQQQLTMRPNFPPTPRKMNPDRTRMQKLRYYQHW